MGHEVILGKVRYDDFGQVQKSHHIMAEEAAAPSDVAASNAERPVEEAHSMSSEASPAPPAEGPMEETQADAAGEVRGPRPCIASLMRLCLHLAQSAPLLLCPLPADIAAAGDAAAAAPEESAAVTADGAASPDVPAAAASELGPSAEAVPGNQVPVGPAGGLEPVAEEPAAMQPDAAAAQGAPEGSAADETAVAQVAKQPSVAFCLAGEGAAQQVGCGLCLGPVRQWLPGTSWTSALTSASRAAACCAQSHVRLGMVGSGVQQVRQGLSIFCPGS